MKNLRALLLLIAAMLTSGCITEVSSIRTGDQASLQQGEGFLLLEVDTTHNIASIMIIGPKSILLTRADLRAGSNYILLNLPAGKYRIERVAFNDRYYFDMNDDLWRFAVEGGAISYVGNLTFRGFAYGLVPDFVLVNRSSFALEYLEDRFPGLLETHRLVFRGPGEDRFFGLVTEQ